MNHVIALLRSRWLRVGFVVVALGAATFAVVHEWADVQSALTSISASLLVGCVALAVVNGLLTLLSWRAVLADLGSDVPIRPASTIYFISQLGKYVPGGIWNIVAATELGADQRIPRRRSLSAMVVSVLVAIVSGLAVAVPALLLAGPTGIDERWVWAALAVSLLVLSPPVLNRILAVALRLARREPLEHPLTVRGTLRATMWSVAGWLVVGLQVWLLARAVGLPPGIDTYLLATGAYALAWTVGFVIIFVPAGVGARELVLALLLSGHVDRDAILVVVLVSRVALTASDLMLGGTALVLGRRRGSAHGTIAQPTSPGPRVG
ncbi:lysylphosphatidylglycerol synthase transmembrane domain-containing protein [Cellulomonas sp. McL0617]|uniref:lysylphosphatidylglycerol synthase transmembrane domain-containing protein n=1 Tax=Cellulomonas sp. McL0617 TaxID=3415675 RepID=UPI003CEABBEA